ncbi:hypothetical protein D3C71_1913110 [compost metagenome]
MRLADALHQLNFKRVFQLGSVCDRKLDTTAHEAAVDAADRVVRAEHRKAGSSRPVEQAVGVGAHRHALGRIALEVGMAVAHRKYCRAGDKRLDAISKSRRVGGRYRTQQRAKIGIVPGLDAARRQA